MCAYCSLNRPRKCLAYHIYHELSRCRPQRRGYAANSCSCSAEWIKINSADELRTSKSDTGTYVCCRFTVPSPISQLQRSLASPSLPTDPARRPVVVVQIRLLVNTGIRRLVRCQSLSGFECGQQRPPAPLPRPMLLPLLFSSHGCATGPARRQEPCPALPFACEAFATGFLPSNENTNGPSL